MIADGELVEHAVVYGQYKGSRQQIREKLAANTDVILRLDVQGAATVGLMPAPPSCLSPRNPKRRSRDDSRDAAVGPEELAGEDRAGGVGKAGVRLCRHQRGRGVGRCCREARRGGGCREDRAAAGGSPWEGGSGGSAHAPSRCEERRRSVLPEFDA